MKFLADGLEAYASGVALLAVHTSISLNDAIIVGLTGKSTKAERHLEAARVLKRLCTVEKIDVKGVHHLEWLLSHKTEIAYGKRRLELGFVKTALDKAERFNSWAYNNFRGVLRDPPTTD